MAMTATEAAEAPLLGCAVPNSADFRGRAAVRSKTGSWKSAYFILGAEMAERFCYYGISSNLINYLTGPMGQTTAAAAANWNVWFGTAALSPIAGALLADSYLGRYRMVIFSSLLYILGLGFLTVSAALNSYSCKSDAENANSCSPSSLQTAFFIVSLYVVALAQGGYKPCLQAFGADQFDVKDRIEAQAKSSFFNWFFWFSCFGMVLALSVLDYIQDNLSWELGFAIPCLVMCFALTLFAFGTFTYRFNLTRDGCNEDETTSSCNDDVDVANPILRLVPILCTSLGYAIVVAQPSTLFTKQAATMDRHVGSTFLIPSASLQLCIPISIMAILLIYDGVFVTFLPISRLQRVGIGLFFSLVSIVVAGVVEIKRLATAHQYGLVDEPTTMIPMSVWWLAPQYLLSGVSDVFAVAGLQEFLYDQVPLSLKSVGIALYISIFGIGSFLSGFLVSIIQSITSRNGNEGWFSNNLNRAHLDYFYWVLAGLSAVFLVAYVYFAKSYTYVEKIIIAAAGNLSPT